MKLEAMNGLINSSRFRKLSVIYRNVDFFPVFNIFLLFFQDERFKNRSKKFQDILRTHGKLSSL